MPNAVSLCMMVKNEERNLPRCLDSVRDLAGELILVDTGSTDRTPRIAARYGAQVIPFDFRIVDFAAARNRAIARASGAFMKPSTPRFCPEADASLEPASASITVFLQTGKREAARTTGTSRS